MYKELIILSLFVVYALAQPAGSLPGIQNGYLLLSSTTDYNADHGVQNSKLNRPIRAWCPYSSPYPNNQEWIMASSKEPFTAYGVTIQGRWDYDQWINSFTISYSLDGLAWTTMPTTFWTGITYRNQAVYIGFSSALRIRNLLLTPKTWQDAIAVRWEVHMAF